MLSLSSCGEKNGGENDGVAITLSPKSLTFNAKNNNDQTVTVKTTASDWDAKSDDNWIVITTDKAAGNFKVNVTALTGDEDRDGVITVSAKGAKSETIAVKQTAGSTAVVTYPSAYGYYVETDATGFDKFCIRIQNDTGNEGLFLTGYLTESDKNPNFYYLEEDTYTIGQSAGNKVFTVGDVVTDSDGTFLVGSYYYTAGNQGIEYARFFMGGEIVVSRNDTKWTIEVNVSAAVDTDNVEYEDLKYKYTGSLPIVDGRDDLGNDVMDIDDFELDGAYWSAAATGESADKVVVVFYKNIGPEWLKVSEFMSLVFNVDKTGAIVDQIADATYNVLSTGAAGTIKAGVESTTSISPSYYGLAQAGESLVKWGTINKGSVATATVDGSTTFTFDLTGLSYKNMIGSARTFDITGTKTVAVTVEQSSSSAPAMLPSLNKAQDNSLLFSNRVIAF